MIDTTSKAQRRALARRANLHGAGIFTKLHGRKGYPVLTSESLPGAIAAWIDRHKGGKLDQRGLGISDAWEALLWALPPRTAPCKVCREETVHLHEFEDEGICPPCKFALRAADPDHDPLRDEYAGGSLHWPARPR